jgi:hypothetical protein
MTCSSATGLLQSTARCSIHQPGIHAAMCALEKAQLQRVRKQREHAAVHKIHTPPITLHWQASAKSDTSASCSLQA